MARYVDVDEFEKRIKPYDTDDRIDKAMYIFAHNKMLYTPTADVVEHKAGKWIYTKKRLARGGYVDASECSVCKKRIMPHIKPNFCPNCGADMREMIEDAEKRKERTMMEITNNEIEAKSASFKDILNETDANIVGAMNKLGRIIECLSSPERSEEKPRQEDSCMKETLLRQRENAEILMKLVLKLEAILF